MDYKITQHGIDQCKDFNSCLSDLCEYFDPQLTNKITEEIDSKNPVIKAFDNLLGDLNREALIDYSPEGISKVCHPDLYVITQEQLESIDMVDHSGLMQRLLEAEYIEELDEELEDPLFLEVVKGNLVNGISLIDAIIEVTDGMKEPEVEVIRAEIMDAKDYDIFTFKEKMLIIWVIDKFNRTKLSELEDTRNKIINQL